MVGQGLRGSIETALEWRTDDVRGEERVLDVSSPCCFVEGAAVDQQIVDIKFLSAAVCRSSSA